MYWTNRYYMFIHLSSNIAWFKANTIVFYTFYAPLFLFHDQIQNKPFKIMINFAGNAIMKHQNSKEKWFKLNWQNSFLQDAKKKQHDLWIFYKPRCQRKKFFMFHMTSIFTLCFAYKCHLMHHENSIWIPGITINKIRR